LSPIRAINSGSAFNLSSGPDLFEGEILMGDTAIKKGELDVLFRPRSVAVMGASSDEKKIGGRPIFYLKHYNFAGAIYPINPNYDEIQGVKTYKTLADVPGDVDLALIALPSVMVEDAVTACADKGVKATVIFSSGYAETGAEGEAAQERLLEIARASGMRIMGPNCMGLAGFDARLIMTFGFSMETMPPKLGPIGIVSQSGAYGAVAYYESRDRQLGVSLWATTGNESDIDLSEILMYYAADDAIKVILLYMEGCKDGPGFMAGLEVARAAGKPVIVTKVGASDVGAEAALSHTASITGSDVVFDTVVAKYGAHRTYSLDEFYDLGYACSKTRSFPNGNRVGLLTISGGIGVLMSDVASHLGLDVPKLTEAAQARIRDIIPYAGTRNPVDITGQTLNDPSLLAKCLDVLIEEGICDIVVIYMAMSTQSPGLADMFMQVFRDIRAKHPDVPIVAGVYAEGDRRRELEELGYIVVREPTRAVKVAASLLRFGRHFAATASEAPQPSAAPVVIPSESLNEVAAKKLLAEAGISTVSETLVTSPAEAATAVTALSGSAALKLVSPDIIHKSEIGGIMLNVDAADAASAYDTLMERGRRHKPNAAIEGVIVAPMISDGIETILGVKRDPVFGPIVVFGLGGVFVEVLQDVTRRLAPFGVTEAHEMIREVKGYPLLEGVCSGEVGDIQALAEALSRLSVLAHENRDQIDSIDINPFLVLPAGKGALAVDALIVPR
jgi:acyl-CoA synthetase (NDP forming)